MSRLLLLLTGGALLMPVAKALPVAVRVTGGWRGRLTAFGRSCLTSPLLLWGGLFGVLLLVGRRALLRLTDYRRLLVLRLPYLDVIKIARR